MESKESIRGVGNALPQSQDRTVLEAEIRALVSQLKEAESDFLAPSDKDKLKYQDFLRQPDTGLTRLLPREIYQNRLTINGGGAYYSFVRLTHDYGYGSDIQLERGQFSVGFAGANFGFLAGVGKIPLDDVSVDHPAAAYLTRYTPPTKEPEARSEYRRARDGFDAGGFTYKTRIPVRGKGTYLLRSIDYRTSDVLVALKVVRQDSDGSVVILWKILKKFPMPELEAVTKVGP
jgi:hypothetical protein